MKDGFVHCGKCDVPVFPQIEVEPRSNRARYLCPVCEGFLGDATPAPAVAAAAGVGPASARPEARPRAASLPPARAADSLDDLDIVALATRKLRVLRVEIQALEKLRREASQLERMLAAAGVDVADGDDATDSATARATALPETSQ